MAAYSKKSFAIAQGKSKNGKTLLLTLKKNPFELMITGRKTEEYRQKSKWIESRLVGKEYEFVRFQNGYSKNSPYFICEYHGYIEQLSQGAAYYGNMVIPFQPGDYKIFLGHITDRSPK